MSEVQEIAGKLSQEQAEWITAMPTIPVAISAEEYDTAPETLFVVVDGWRNEWFGWISAHYHGDGGPWMLTAALNDVGLQVRARLQATQAE